MNNRWHVSSWSAGFPLRLAALGLGFALASCTSAPRPAVATKAGAPAPPPAAGKLNSEISTAKAPVAATATTGNPQSAIRNPKSSASAAPLLPPAMRPVGRVLSVDDKAQTAIVELSRYAALPAGLDGETLFARDHDLRPMARLEGTAYLRGTILGVKTLEGRPAVGDEVVLPAPVAKPPEPPAAAEPKN